MNPDKKIIIDSLLDRVNASPYLIVIDYTGLTVPQFSELRNRLADNGEIRGLVRPILILLVAIHVGAALYNQFIRKDGTLTRMLRPH